MVSTEDGFAIAERDLEIRGPGDFFGTRQWGLPGLRASNLLRDSDLLEEARVEAFRWVEEMENGAATPLKAFLAEGGWERRFGLAEVG
jgi:ATP-dependent DNA helicase RecG